MTIPELWTMGERTLAVIGGIVVFSVAAAALLAWLLGPLEEEDES